METFTPSEVKSVVRAAMTILGSRTSPKKAAAVRANGKLGGRPKGSKSSKPAK